MPGDMTKRTGKPKKKAAPKKDRAWFERKVSELKAELEKLPADRQERLEKDLETGKEIRRITAKGWIHSVALSPDGRQALSGGASSSNCSLTASESSTAEMRSDSSSESTRVQRLPGPPHHSEILAKIALKKHPKHKKAHLRFCAFCAILWQSKLCAECFDCCFWC